MCSLHRIDPQNWSRNNFRATTKFFSRRLQCMQCKPNTLRRVLSRTLRDRATRGRAYVKPPRICQASSSARSHQQEFRAM